MRSRLVGAQIIVRVIYWFAIPGSSGSDGGSFSACVNLLFHFIQVVSGERSDKYFCGAKLRHDAGSLSGMFNNSVHSYIGQNVLSEHIHCVKHFSDYPTMDNFLYPLFHTKSSDNASRYSNPDVDALIIKARAETDKEKSTALLREANALIGDYVPIIPVTYYAKKMVGSSKILSFYVDPQDRYDFAHAKLVKK